MGYFSQPVLVMFLGFPGSGKTYFAKALADEMNAVRISSDAMRQAIFGSREAMDKIYNSPEREKLNSYVSSSLDYVTEQIIMRGYDVVYDTHHNKRTDREPLERIAARYNAKPVVVRIKTPYDVALKRGQTRQESADERQLSKDKMREAMDRHIATTDEPEDHEFVIDIDGQSPFTEQFKVFEIAVSGSLR